MTTVQCPPTIRVRGVHSPEHYFYNLTHVTVKDLYVDVFSCSLKTNFSLNKAHSFSFFSVIMMYSFLMEQGIICLKIIVKF